MNRLRDFWRRQALRIDALSLRERLLLFASLAVLLVALADVLVLSPQLAEHKRITTRLRAQAAEIDTLRTSLAQTGASADTPAARALRALQQTRSEQAAVDTEITRRMADGSSGARLQDLLGQVLRRHPRLTLLRLATAPAAAPSAAAALPLQGVEIGVRGSYPELAQYVADIEHALPGLRWDELAVLRVEQGAELRARVALAGDAR